MLKVERGCDQNVELMRVVTAARQSEYFTQVNRSTDDEDVPLSGDQSTAVQNCKEKLQMMKQTKNKAHNLCLQHGSKVTDRWIYIGAVKSSRD